LNLKISLNDSKRKIITNSKYFNYPRSPKNCFFIDKNFYNGISHFDKNISYRSRPYFSTVNFKRREDMRYSLKLN
jgi:hypothetical protein